MMMMIMTDLDGVQIVAKIAVGYGKLSTVSLRESHVTESCKVVKND